MVPDPYRVVCERGLAEGRERGKVALTARASLEWSHDPD